VGTISPTSVTLRTVGTGYGTFQEAGVRAGEIIAYRAWRVQNGFLHSMHISDYVWTPKRIEKARLDNPYGGCGLHAYKTMERAKSEYHSLSYSMAYGEVALWGEVYEHEWGYRAQYAKVIKITDMNLSMLRFYTKARLRSKYGV